MLKSSKSKTWCGALAFLAAMWMGGCASTASEFSSQTVAEWQCRTEHMRQLEAMLSEPVEMVSEESPAIEPETAVGSYPGVW